MKATTRTVQTPGTQRRPSIGERRRAASSARAHRRLARADRYFARTERTVEASVARVIAAEQALEIAIDDPTATEIDVDGLTVARGVVPEVLAMAQHDLRVALRRHTDAAARLCHCLSAVSDSTGDRHVMTSA